MKKSFQINHGEIQKMSGRDQALFFDIRNNPEGYSRSFITESGLPYMLDRLDNREEVMPIIELYNWILENN